MARDSLGLPSLTVLLLLAASLPAAEPVARVDAHADRLTLIVDDLGYYHVPLPAGSTRQQADGRFALEMPLPSRNFLPESLTGHDAEATPPGTALRLAAAEAWAGPPTPVQYSFGEIGVRPGNFGLVFTASVRAPSGTAGETPVQLRLDWEPKDAAGDGRTAAAAHAVGAAWRRLAVHLPFDDRALEGTATVRLTAEAAVEVAGLQLEPWGDYPVFQREPTAWLRGGAVRNVRPPTLSARLIPIDWQQGAVALAVRLGEPGQTPTGERQILFVGNSWRGPLEILTDRVRVGKATVPAPALRGLLNDGAEHRLLVSWDAHDVHLYADAALLARGRMPAGEIEVPDDPRLWIGTHDPRPRNFGGSIRELRFYDRPVTPDELADTAVVTGPLLAPPLRRVFRRDEENLVLDLPLIGSVPPELSVALTGIPGGAAELVRAGEAATLRLRFEPWQHPTGPLEAEIRLATPAGPLRRWPWPIQIVPALPRDLYPVGNWGSPGTGADLAWARDIGLTLIDSRNRTAGYLNEVARHGLLASLNFANLRGSPHPATPENLARADSEADLMTADIRPFPWVVSCVLNSEGHGTDRIAASPLAMASLRETLGLDEPLFPPAGTPLHLANRPRVDLSGFAATGIVPDDFLPLRYVDWLMVEGDGMNMASRITSDRLAAAAPWVEVVMEPATPRPSAVRYAAWADTLSNWRYANSPTPMLTIWRQGLAAARAAGKKYYPLSGHQYYSPRVFVAAGDTRTEIPPSGDMAAAFLWTGFALPAAEVRCFGWWQRNWAENERLRPGSNARIAAAIAEVSRLGPVVGEVPLRPAQLAVFMPVANMLGRGSDEWWHAYGDLVSTVVNFFAAHDLPVDFVYEEQVLAGELASYPFVYIPALRYQRAGVHEAVEAWRRAGGRLILDTLAGDAFQADIVAPLIGDSRRGQAYRLDEDRSREWVAGFRPLTTPHARLEDGAAIVITKELPGTRFVIAVNDRWASAAVGSDLLGVEQGGDIIDEVREFAARDGVRTLTADLRDVGVPQTIRLSLLEGPEAAIFDLRRGLRLQAPVGRDGRRELELPLGPGEAAVLAIYPRPPDRLELVPPPAAAAGRIAEIEVRLLDGDGQPLPGRQGVDLEVSDAAGRRTDESAIYRLEDGRTTVRVRLPRNAPAGRWRITATDLAGSLTAETFLDVAAEAE